jgi:hypothetical protein
MGVEYEIANEKTKEYIDIGKGLIFRYMFNDYLDGHIDLSMFGQYLIENWKLDDKEYVKYVADNVQEYVDKWSDDLIFCGDEDYTRLDGSYGMKEDMDFFRHSGDWEKIWSRYID